MNIYDTPLNELLANKQIYSIFESSFALNPWLNLMPLLESESTINIMHKDGSIPDDIIEDLKARLEAANINTEDI